VAARLPRWAGSEAARVLPAGRAGAAVLGEGSEGRAGGAARGAGRRPPAGSGTLDAWVSSAGGVVLVGWCPGVCGRVHAWAVWLCWLLKFFLGLRLGWALELGPCGTF